MYRLTLLGQVKIERVGDVALRFRSQTELAMLVYLAHSGLTHSRESIADLLWESRTTRQSLSNLRTALTRFRRTADDALTITRKALAIAPAAFEQIDSVQLSRALQGQPDLHSAADAA